MQKKRILFIAPSSYDNQGRIIKSRKAFMTARTSLYLAALTPDRFECLALNELVDDLRFDLNVDLVILTGFLFNVSRMVDISREFRKRGIPVIAGGIGVFALQEELMEQDAFTSLVIGEAEGIWDNILDDFMHSKLKKRYETLDRPSLDKIPSPRNNLINSKKYLKLDIFNRKNIYLTETSRGCPFVCNFCSVASYFGRKVRYRPVGDVVEEIRQSGSRYIFFVDNNVVVDKDRARELFQALIPLGVRWNASFDCSVIRDPDLLYLASKSGCFAAVIGVESLIQKNFITLNKPQNIGLSIKEVLDVLRKAKIVPMTHMIFGLDYDTESSIDWTFDKLIENKVELLVPWILTPFPRTPLYEECLKEGRLLHKNYALYDSMHTVFNPKSISPEALNRSVWKGLRRFYSFQNIFKRVLLRNDLVDALKLIHGTLLINKHFSYQVFKGISPNSNAV